MLDWPFVSMRNGWRDEESASLSVAAGCRNSRKLLRVRERLRTMGAASVAGVAAGLVCGVLARLAMRLIVVVLGQAAEFSITGSAGVVMTFIAMADALAVLYVLVSAGYRRGPSAWLWSLGGLGLLAFAVFLTPLRQEVARGPAFIVLFIPIGILLGWWPAALGRVLANRFPASAGALPSAAYGVLSIPGLISLVAIPLLMIFGILQLVGAIPVPST